MMHGAATLPTLHRSFNCSRHRSHGSTWAAAVVFRALLRPLCWPSLATVGSIWSRAIIKRQPSCERLFAKQVEGGPIHPVRIEDAPSIVQDCDFVSARALADLGKLLAHVEPWAQRNANLRAYFHKGRDYRAEIQKAHGGWRFDLLEHKSAVERDSVVLEVFNLRRAS